MNFSKRYNFNEVQDFKALANSEKLFEYIRDLEDEIEYSKRTINNKTKLYVSKHKYNLLPDISKKDYCFIDEENQLIQYKYYYLNILDKRLIENQNKYLKVLKEREIELIEYLKSIDEIKEYI